MKLLILITFSIASLNVFATEVGEDQKTPCPYANQSSKRDAKEVVSTESDSQQVETKTISQ